MLTRSHCSPVPESHHPPELPRRGPSLADDGARFYRAWFRIFCRHEPCARRALRAQCAPDRKLRRPVALSQSKSDSPGRQFRPSRSGWGGGVFSPPPHAPPKPVRCREKRAVRALAFLCPCRSTPSPCRCDEYLLFYVRLLYLLYS